MDKNEISTSRLSKVIILQTYIRTDRQADRHTYILQRNYYQAASWMIIMSNWPALAAAAVNIFAHCAVHNVTAMQY